MSHRVRSRLVTKAIHCTDSKVEADSHRITVTASLSHIRADPSARRSQYAGRYAVELATRWEQRATAPRQSCSMITVSSSTSPPGTRRKTIAAKPSARTSSFLAACVGAEHRCCRLAKSKASSLDVASDGWKRANRARCQPLFLRSVWWLEICRVQKLAPTQLAT